MDSGMRSPRSQNIIVCLYVQVLDFNEILKAIEVEETTEQPAKADA